MKPSIASLGFTAETAVHTLHGLIPIGDIRVGDWVQTETPITQMPLFRHMLPEIPYLTVRYDEVIGIDAQKTKHVVQFHFGFNDANEPLTVTAGVNQRFFLTPINDDYEDLEKLNLKLPWTACGDMIRGFNMTNRFFEEEQDHMFEKLTLERPVGLLKLKVRNSPTYFVGNSGLWTHSEG